MSVFLFWVWFLVAVGSTVTVTYLDVIKGRKITWREVGFLLLGCFMVGIPNFFN